MSRALTEDEQARVQRAIERIDDYALLTVKEAAAVLRTSDEQVTEAIHSGKLKAVRISDTKGHKVTIAAIKAYIEEMEAEFAQSLGPAPRMALAIAGEKRSRFGKRQPRSG